VTGPKERYFHQPLFDYKRNIGYIANQMRDRSEELYETVVPADYEVTRDEYSEALENHAEELARYAALVETLLHHGTRGFYLKGCRCEWCKAANHQYTQRRSGKSRIKFVQSILEDGL
jgi:hypothetical protein